MGTTKTFWLTAAVVTAAIVLPFGTVLLLAGAAARKRMTLANGAEEPYAAWFRLRDDLLAGRKN